MISSVAAFAPIHVPLAARTPSALGVAVDTSDIKNGMTLELDGEPYKVLSFSIMKQARGAAKTTIKFKNLIRGTTIENTYRSGEKFETALIEKKAHQFTYEDGVSYYVSLFVGWYDCCSDGKHSDHKFFVMHYRIFLCFCRMLFSL